MLKVDEIGISPPPWHVGTKDEGWFFGNVTSAGDQKNKRVVATTNYHFASHDKDNTFIAAGPKVYEALRKLVEHIENECVPAGDKEMELLNEAKEALLDASGENASEAG